MITKSIIQSDIITTCKALDYDGSFASHEHYAMTLFDILVKHGAMPKTSVPDAFAIWQHFPKNPSAFKQDVEKWTLDPEDAPTPSDLMAKYMQPDTSKATI